MIRGRGSDALRSEWSRVTEEGGLMWRAAKAAKQAKELGLAQVAYSRHYSSDSFSATLFPGDGIGPEISTAVKHIFKAAGVSVGWDEQRVGTSIDPSTNSFVSRANLDSVLVTLSTFGS